MEELFQILIILFFIGASIASSLKKKKQQMQRQSSKTLPNNLGNIKQRPSVDILEDILGFKIETPTIEPQVEKSTYDAEYADTFKEHESWNPANEFNMENYDSENNFKQKTEAVKSYYQSTKKQLKVLDKNETIDNFEIRPTSKFQKLLLKPSNVQEYLIVSEILNKPKALRR